MKGQAIGDILMTVIESGTALAGTSGEHQWQRADGYPAPAGSIRKPSDSGRTMSLMAGLEHGIVDGTSDWNLCFGAQVI